MSEHRYDPRSIEPKWQEIWERERTWEVSNDEVDGEPEVLRPRDAAVPLGRAAHGAPEELLRRRRGRALPPPHGPQGAAPDGLRRVRAAGREPRDQDGRAPARLDREVDRAVPDAAAPLGAVDRLVARVRHARAALLPLDPVAVPEAVRARPGLPQGGRGQLVPGRRDRAGQRAGHRRPLRALRQPGRGAPARAVVLPHHGLRRPPARRPRGHPLALARQDDAAQLDRPLRGRRGHVRRSRDRRGVPRLHHAPGHAVRRDVLRDGARAPRRAPAGRRHRAREGRARLRQQGADGVQRRAQRRRPHEDRRPAGPQRRQPGQRRADPDVGRRLRADGVRHRRDHGRPGPRRARLRLRDDVRPADPQGDRLRRRAALLRRRPDRQLPSRLRRDAQPRRAGEDRRLARRPGQGPPLDQLPPARLAALAPALLGLPDPDRLLRDAAGWCPVPEDQLPVLLPDVEDYAPKGRSPLAAAEDWVNTDCPSCGGARAPRDGHDGHVRRLVLVLPALHGRATTTRRRGIPAVTNALDARSTSTSAASSTRSCT